MRFPATPIFIVATGIGWGLVAPVTRLCFEADPRVFDGATFTIARGTWTALAWLPAFVYLAVRERGALDRATLLRLFALGALWGPGVMGTFAIATEKTALAHVVFSVGLSPVSAGLFATLAYRGTIDGPRRASLLLGAVGVGLLAFTRGSAHASVAGDAVLLAWVIVFGLYATLAVAAMRRLSPLLVTASANIFGGALLALCVPFVPAAPAAISGVMTHPSLVLPFFGEIVLLGGLMAPLAYSYALGRASVSAVTGGAQYVSIATGTSAAIVLFHEAFGLPTILAGLLLAASLGLSLLPREAAPLPAS